MKSVYVDDILHPPTLDPVGMFGTLRRQTVEVETDFQRDRYQEMGEENGRF